MKDLAEFLGIFEITEDQIKKRGGGGDLSDTSSNISYVTQSAFKPKISQLDVIREHLTTKEEDDDHDAIYDAYNDNLAIINNNDVTSTNDYYNIFKHDIWGIYHYRYDYFHYPYHYQVKI